MTEVLSGQCHRESLRLRAVELRRHGNDHARRQVMRKTRLSTQASFFSLDFFDTDFTGAALSIGGSSVHENNGVGPADSFCQLRSELMQAQNFDFPGRELYFQRVGHTPGQAVVGAQRIPVGDDEHADSPNARGTSKTTCATW